MWKLTCILIVSTMLARAQTVVNGGRTISGPLDASGATTTKPAKSGTSLPGTCGVGEQFFRTSGVTASQNLYLCTATNTWSQVGPFTSQIGAVIDGGGSVLTAGQKAYIPIPYAGTIAGYTIVADQTGSIAIEVDKLNNAIPAVTTNSICASACPALTSSQLVTSTTLTGWTTAIGGSLATNDIVSFYVTGTPTSVTRVTITLVIQR